MISKSLNFIYAKSIAIMGGTFDPIHYGHLMTAEAVRKEFDIEKVIFVPSGNPPHKGNKEVLDVEFRYVMTELATLGNDKFDISAIEARREGISYTVDTIEEIRKHCSADTKIYFIIGADAVENILTWKNAKKLLNLCEFIAVTRPGYDKKKLLEHITNIKSEYKVNILFLQIPELAISSTDIRQRIQDNKSISYLLPEAVEKYIYKYGLYKKKFLAKNLDYNAIDIMLKEDLSLNRYIHTMGVAEEAVKLAKAYNEDEDKAYVAALFHDCAKELEDTKKLELCEEYGINLDSILISQISLSHGFLGAELARRFFGIEDKELLDAIRYHTTGRKNMSKLEKIVYIADNIEPNRGNTKDLQELRVIAYKDLDEAMIICLRKSLDMAIAKKAMFHPLGIEALDHILSTRATKQKK